MSSNMRSLIPHPHELRAIQAGTLRQSWRPMKEQPPYLTMGKSTAFALAKQAPYQPGDILAVKETWCNTWPFTGQKCPEGPCYRSTDEGDCGAALTGQKWSSPATMPAWAARSWLRVTGVAAKRVRDMTEDDAQAIGVQPSNYDGFLGGASIVWDALYAGRGLSWATNPWCFVTTVEQTKKPEAL